MRNLNKDRDKMKDFITINGRAIGPSHPPYVIAEISGNHNGDINKALELVSLAKSSGADAVKIQTYTPDTMTIQCDSKLFQIKGGLWDGHSLYDLYKWAHTPWEWHEKIFQRAKEVGIACFSTPFDETAIDFLEGFNVPAYKVASFELTDLILIEAIAKTKKPVIISTGMASEEEISDAIQTIHKFHDNLVVLHCVSGYPTPSSQSNISTIKLIANKFKVLVGLSDHSLSNAGAIASVAMGGCVIEKHFIKSRNDQGPDSAFSLEPAEMQSLCAQSKEAWESLGEPSFNRKEVEKSNVVFRRSLFFVNNLKKGDLIQAKDVRRIRPGYGLAPKFLDQVLGKRVTQDISRGTPVELKHINDL